MAGVASDAVHPLTRSVQSLTRSRVTNPKDGLLVDCVLCGRLMFGQEDDTTPMDCRQCFSFLACRLCYARMVSEKSRCACGITVANHTYGPARSLIQQQNAALSIYCQHKEFGCGWSGPMEKQKDHLCTCAPLLLKETRAELARKNEDLNRTKQELKDKKEELKRAKHELKDKNEDLKRAKHDLKDMSIQRALSASLSEQNQNLSIELSELKKRSRQSLDDNNRLKEDVVGLRKKLRVISSIVDVKSPKEEDESFEGPGTPVETPGAPESPFYCPPSPL